MKFITITGGLGNQMFIAAFREELLERGFRAVLFVPFKKSSKKYGHQGYELEKLFEIKPGKGYLELFAIELLSLYNHLLRITPVKSRHFFYRAVGISIVTVPENFIFYSSVFEFKNTNELYRGTWQSELFFSNAQKRVKEIFVFKKKMASEKTTEMINQIGNENGVSIHIRRGDYLSNQYANGFAGVCTPDYYIRAIDLIKEKVDKPVFYVFTDDPEWVNENFKLENAVYVHHNKGIDSWQDMYLMSECKHNIIANSSFSWWGAWLNANPTKIVIAPLKWWKPFEQDNVVPKEWIRL